MNNYDTATGVGTEVTFTNNTADYIQVKGPTYPNITYTYTNSNWHAEVPDFEITLAKGRVKFEKGHVRFEGEVDLDEASIAFWLKVGSRNPLNKIIEKAHDEIEALKKEIQSIKNENNKGPESKE